MSYLKGPVLTAVKTMAPKCVSFILSYAGLLCFVYFIQVDGSTSTVFSVTRSSNIGDSFEVHLQNDSICEAASCEQYGGFLREANQGDTGKCSCYCGDSRKPTFYSIKSGEQSCVKDTEVWEDTKGGKAFRQFTSGHFK